MKLFKLDFIGHYPIGTAAIVVAENLAEAYRLACIMLKENNLWESQFSYERLEGFQPAHLQEITLKDIGYYMLCDGEY